MNLLNLVITLIELVKKYGVFDEYDFEFIQVDQKPEFYLGVIVLRTKKE